jgi:hypothetical protein
VYYNTADEKLYLYDGGAWKALSQNNISAGNPAGMMTWKGSSAAAPASPQANWVYYNVTDEKLYLYDGGTWKALSQNNISAGSPAGMMTWKGSSAAAPASPQEGWVYYNTGDGKLCLYDGSTWQILADNSYTLPVHAISLDRSGTQTFPAAVVGYSARVPLSVTITNTGGQDTGALIIALSGSSETGVTGIPVGGTHTFTVVPHIGLAVGSYTAGVTVSGANITAKAFSVHFAVNAYSYGIGVSQTTAHTFPSRNFGYGDQSSSALPVTITNNQDQNTGSLTITVSPTNIFIVSPTTITGIDAEDAANFTVKPTTGLAAAPTPYTATVTVSGGADISAKSFDVSFTVNPASFATVPVITAITPDTNGIRIDWDAAIPAPYSYRVYWKKGSHSATAAIKTGPGNGSAAGIAAASANYTITGLEGAALYSVFVEAVKTGYSGESAIQTATTKAGFTGSLAFSVTGVTANNLNYSVSNSALSPSAVDSYDIYYMEGDQTVPNVLSNNVKVNKTTATGSVNLNPGAFYTVLAVAKKADYNDSNPSNAVNVVFSPAINLAGAVGQYETHGQGWKYTDSVYTILDGADVTVSGTTTVRRIEAAASATAELTLNNAYITAIASSSAFKLNTGANITMTLAGTNELKTATEGAAGVQTTDGSLTINGTGSLAVEGGSSAGYGGNGGGAGIGGSGSLNGNGNAGGTITISGSAIVTAQGGGSSSSYTGSGAGIGGGGSSNYSSSSNSSGGAGRTITISGSAVVMAQGGSNTYMGAGIGGGGGYGSGGAAGGVTILGGTVIAKSPTNGIGAGQGGATGTINPPQNAVVFASSADGLTTNLANGISIGDATIGIDGAYPGFTATVTLQNDMTVPAGATLTIPAGVILNKNGHTVTGSVNNTGGTIFN